MENHMNRSARNWFILITIVVVALLAALWATTTVWFPRFPWGPRERPPLDIYGDIELFYTLKAVFSTVNVTLLVFLLLTYFSIYRKTRSEFTIGLMIFSSVFLLNVVASNPLVIRAFGYLMFGLGPFAMLPDIFTSLALGVLLYLSIKY